jgi:hypothetical protein
MKKELIQKLHKNFEDCAHHIVPEDLPAAEEVKKFERRLKSEEKKLSGFGLKD